MKTKSKAMAAVVAGALLAGAGPVRAEPHPSVVTGFLVFLGVTLGLVAYHHDFGGADERLEIRDESGRKKERSLLLMSPPVRADEEEPVEIAAGLAWSAKF